MGDETHALASVRPGSAPEPPDDDDDDRERGLDQLAERLAEGWGSAQATER
jgi:hypothetical protein